MNRLRGHSKEKGFTPEDDQGEGMSEIAEEPRGGGYETPLVTVDMKLAAVKAYLKTVTRLGGKGTVNPVALVDAIDAALNVSASAHPILTGAWQSIETAPKDGTAILLCDARVKDCMVIAFFEESYDEYVWHVADSCAYHCQAFTHWRHLPPGPLTDEAKLRRSAAAPINDGEK